MPRGPGYRDHHAPGRGHTLGASASRRRRRPDGAPPRTALGRAAAPARPADSRTPPLRGNDAVPARRRKRPGAAAPNRRALSPAPPPRGNDAPAARALAHSSPPPLPAPVRLPPTPPEEIC